MTPNGGGGESDRDLTAKRNTTQRVVFLFGAGCEARTRHRHPAKGLREGPFAGTLPDLDFDCRASAAGGGSEFAYA